MSQDVRRKPGKPWLLNLLWTAALMTFVYVMSYPIVLRITPHRPISNTPGYQPVEWLYDETPVAITLWQWSRFCGSEDELRSRATSRYVDSRVKPAIPDGL